MTRTLLRGIAATALALLSAGASAQTVPPMPVTITPLTITVTPGARQTFRGFGASALNFGREYQTLTPAQRRLLSRTLWHDLRFQTLRLWFNTDQYAPTPGAHDMTTFRANYVDSGLIADARAQGVTTLLLAPDHVPTYMTEKSAQGSAETGMALKPSATDAYADLLADFLQRLRRETGVVMDVTGVQNEPNDQERFTPAQVVEVVKRLRADLDADGLTRVEIIAPEQANVDGGMLETAHALRADPDAWRALAGLASHSYNNATTPDSAALVAGTGKSYWMTEASDNGPEVPGDAQRAASLASRFLNDANHRVTHWIHFVGFEVPDPHDNATRILAYTPAPFALTVFQKYYYYRQLSGAFDVGAVFRHSVSSLDGDMTWTFGRKPHVNAAAARNPDGAWAVGLSDDTADDFPATTPFQRDNSGFPAQAFAVTVRVPELSAVHALRFAVRRSNSGVNDVPAGTVVMRDGVVTVPRIGPLDLITLRSLPAARALKKKSPPQGFNPGNAPKQDSMTDEANRECRGRHGHAKSIRQKRVRTSAGPGGVPDRPAAGRRGCAR